MLNEATCIPSFFCFLFCYVNHRPIAKEKEKEKEKHATREGLEAGYPEPSEEQKVRAVAYVCDSYCTFVASFFRSSFLACFLSFLSFLSFFRSPSLTHASLSYPPRRASAVLPCLALLRFRSTPLRCVALCVVMLW